ncbi:hypothetical protein [Microbacterium sp.]|nr:hypothetical protein [Microbacterium sp.]
MGTRRYRRALSSSTAFFHGALSVFLNASAIEVVRLTPSRPIAPLALR